MVLLGWNGIGENVSSMDYTPDKLKVTSSCINNLPGSMECKSIMMLLEGVRIGGNGYCD